MSRITTNLAVYHNQHSGANKLGRLLWGLVWALLFRPSPTPFHCWRRFLLRWFGAKIDRGAHPYPRAKIWAPWNLEMGSHSCLSNDVDCYCVDKIRLGAHSVISQYGFLCTASHDYTDPTFPLVTAPIDIGERVWVAADTYIGPGVRVGNNAVIGARSSVYKDVPPSTIVGGNPARFLKLRVLRDPLSPAASQGSQ
jgi:putative colanic acid biosynthesis acetyltransferase WcaF